jgi:2-methylcitrate dehydratase PrpD
MGTLASAQMSLPYAIATVLVNGHAGIGAYPTRSVTTRALAAAMERVVLEMDPSMSDLDEPCHHARAADAGPAFAAGQRAARRPAQSAIG